MRPANVLTDRSWKALIASDWFLNSTNTLTFAWICVDKWCTMQFATAPYCSHSYLTSSLRNSSTSSGSTRFSRTSTAEVLAGIAGVIMVSSIDMTCMLVTALYSINPDVASVFFATRGLMMPCSCLPRPLPFQPMASIIFFILLSLLTYASSAVSAYYSTETGILERLSLA